MKFVKKAQALSTEAIVVFALLVLFFTLVFAVSFNENIKLNKYRRWQSQHDDCVKLSQAIDAAFLHSFSIILRISNNATIQHTSITVGDVACTFAGIANHTNLTSGNVLIKKQDEIVVLQNV